MQQQQRPNNRVGLWKTTSKKGTEYLGGTWNGKKVMVFKNEKPTQEKSPTHFLVVGDVAQQQKTAQPSKFAKKQPPMGHDEEGDDLPF